MKALGSVPQVKKFPSIISLFIASRLLDPVLSNPILLATCLFELDFSRFQLALYPALLAGDVLSHHLSARLPMLFSPHSFIRLGATRVEISRNQALSIVTTLVTLLSIRVFRRCSWMPQFTQL